MAELDVIAELLRHQRQDIATSMDQTASRTTETAELLGKIEALRVRSEDTLRRFQLSVEASELLNGEERGDDGA